MAERRTRPPTPEQAPGAGATSAPHGHPSTTVSRYLEAIFYITAEGETVRASRLAEWLGVSQPTAGATLQRMAREGLLSISAGKAITLTPNGATEAARIVRRHRIAERWLTDTVGLDWAQADEEASRLEHAFSDDLANRLHELIGRPTTCPHGNVIPGVAVSRPPERPLSGLAPGEQSVVQRISEVAEHEAPELLRYLAEQGFHLGMPVAVLSASRAAGTITVRADEREMTIALEVAERIQVRA